MKIVFFLIIAIFAYAVDIDANSFEASFTQTVTNEQGKSFKYSGRIIAKKPNYALWTYTKPFKKEIFVNGDKVTVYEPKLAQATISKSANIPNIYELAKKAKAISKDEFEASYDGVKIYFKLQDGTPVKIYYKDKIDNTVEIVFSNIKKNIPIDNAEFIFIPPKDTDIIN